MTPHCELGGALRLPGTVARHEPSTADWARLGELLAPQYANGLFTVLRVDHDRDLVRRVYSSDPRHYAPGGTKNLLATGWARHVIEEGRCFIASTREQMASAFADHQILSDIGCTTALNIPVRQGADVVWTLNLLRGDTPYTPAHAASARARYAQWIEELYPCCNLRRSDVDERHD